MNKWALDYLYTTYLSYETLKVVDFDSTKNASMLSMAITLLLMERVSTFFHFYNTAFKL